MHKSKSIYFKASKHDKIYFSENQISNFISLEFNYLSSAIKVYKKNVKKNYVHNKKALNTKSGNKIVDKRFRKTRENIAIIFNLRDLYK